MYNESWSWVGIQTEEVVGENIVGNLPQPYLTFL
jgi:hypothetical protein